MFFYTCFITFDEVPNMENNMQQQTRFYPTLPITKTQHLDPVLRQFIVRPYVVFLPRM